MFRFVNSGLKQSISTLPNSVYHCPSLHKKGTDDDNENKKLSLISSKFEQTIGFYKNFHNQNKFNFDKRNLVLELSFDFDLNKSVQNNNNQINSHINDFLINFYPYCENKSISVNSKIPKSINEKPNKFSDNKKNPSNRIFKEIENKPDFFLLSPNKQNTGNGKCNFINIKQTQTAINDDKLLNKQVKISEIKKNNENIKIEENSQHDMKINHFNVLGHELNTKGCEAAKLLDNSTALQYWNCAAAFHYPPSQFNLGVYFQSIKDFVKAEKWYRLAVQSGEHPVAAYNLALLLNNKLDAKLKGEIKDLLIISANQGSKEAQNCIECIRNSN